MSGTTESFVETIGKFSQHILDYKLDDAASLSKVLKTSQNNIDGQLLEIKKSIQNLTTAASNKAQRDEVQGLQMISLALIIAIFLGLILPQLIARLITRPIGMLSDRLKEIADGDGDLSIRLSEKGSYEIVQVASSFNHFIGKLSSTISKVNSSANALGHSSEQSIDIMSKTLVSIEQQHSETEMVANAISQMNSATAGRCSQYF